jgi:hypothetical protein
MIEDLSAAVADTIAKKVVFELVKGKSVEELVNLTVDEALNNVIPFTEMLEDRVVTRLISIIEEAVENIKKKGDIDFTTLWTTPKLDTVIDQDV